MRKLLEPEFPGKREFVAQLTDILVCPIDEAGGLSLKVNSSHAPSPLKESRIPVEAEYFDGFYPDYEYQPAVRILIYVANGYLSELEIYKDDGKAILKQPDIEEIELTVRKSAT